MPTVTDELQRKYVKDAKELGSNGFIAKYRNPPKIINIEGAYSDGIYSLELPQDKVFYIEFMDGKYSQSYVL